jgi:hypothetical protein
MQGVA